VRLEARGVHQVGNSLAALSIACLCGVGLEAAAAALGEARLSPWRMEVTRIPNGAVVLNDAYNANPASMTAALESLAAIPAERRVAVVGVMAELGPSSRQEHRSIVDIATRLGVELIVVGTAEYGIAGVAGIDEAMERLGPLGEGDAVLVKASRVAGLEELAARLIEVGQRKRP
jgi:UDP-N-acetylmuramoyl-tripeptide--D-alanyl-D-alanine ligase